MLVTRKKRGLQRTSYIVGWNDTRIETKITPKRITSSGHQRSTHDIDSLDELILNILLYHLQILTENHGHLNSRLAALPANRPVIIKPAMATDVSAQARPAQSSSFPTMVLIAGWLIPGAGHIMQRKWIRGGLIMVSILSMFTIGLALKGKIYSPNTGDLLDILNFAGDLGNGLLYVLARAFDLGQAAVQVATADYGTKFIVVAGLLNVISAVDAHSLATGRKRS